MAVSRPMRRVCLLMDDQGSWEARVAVSAMTRASSRPVPASSEGAYDSLYTIIDRHDTVLSNGAPDAAVRGLIFEGEPTPMPDPPGGAGHR